MPLDPIIHYRINKSAPP